MHRLVLAAVTLALVACATPEERCIARATQDLRVVTALIDETEANIARGYAIEEVSTERLVMRICREDGQREICWIPETDVRRKPVAIDLDAERKKLASLREKKAELEVRARAALAACRSLAEG